MLNSALDPIARAIGFHRVDRVVVGCLRLEAVYTHAENGIKMARVQPDWRFCCLAKVLWIRTVVHYSVMLGHAPGVVGGHPTDWKEGIGAFIFGPLVVLHACAFFLGR